MFYCKPGCSDELDPERHGPPAAVTEAFADIRLRSGSVVPSGGAVSVHTAVLRLESRRRIGSQY